jgi:Tol biopolymer transport system component
MKPSAQSIVIASALAASMLLSGCNSSHSTTITPPPASSPAYVYLQAPQISVSLQMALAGNLAAQRSVILELRQKVQRAMLLSKARRALQRAGIALPASTGSSTPQIDLYLVKAGSSSAVKLDTSTIIFTGAALSPDGTQIAYTALDASQMSQLYVAPVANFSQATQLTSGSTNNYAYPVFSPDGKTIATTVAAGNLYSPSLGIALVPAAGGQPTMLDLGNSAGFSGAAVFTPDGSHLIFSASPTTAVQQPAYVAIYECNLDGSGVKQLSNPSDNADYDFLPSVSADGNTIIFTRLAPSASGLPVTANIESMPITGETPSAPAKPLTTDNLSLGGTFIGSTSNSHILYVDIKVTGSSSTPSFEGAALYEMNPDGSDPQPVISVSGGAIFP